MAERSAPHGGEGGVLLAGGGTAGHVNPLLAVADELLGRRPGLRLAALGTTAGLEARLLPEHGLTMVAVPRVPLPRRPTLDWFALPARLRTAVRAAEGAIQDVGAGVVVGFGGYVATPAYLAARRLGVPVVVHEQNARPGLANRLGARWAAQVAVTFPGTPLRHAQVTGLPLRAAIRDLAEARARDGRAARAAGAAALGLDPGRVTLLVTGGSLGALSVNRAVAGAAAALLAADVQVLHLAGRGKADEVRAAVAGVPGAERYHVLEYLSAMEHALAAADLVVARSGAGTVCELAALGLPAVYVPLSVGNGEQRLNAQGLVRAGGGLLVADEDFTADWARQHLPPLLSGPDAGRRRADMAAAAAGQGVRDGAARVADLVERVLGASTAVAADPVPPLDPVPADPPPVDALGAVHLIGVGGAGMSAVALLLAARGLSVSGSDAQDSPVLDALRAAGVRVRVGHDAAALDGVDTVVVSSAVRESNVELAAARERGLRVLHRSAALAALMTGRDAVAVAGAHGKTTTSGMLAVALLDAGADPSFAVGGQVLADGAALGGARAGSGPFVLEADESDGSFLAYRPLVAVVTNVEADHLDHYGTPAAFEAAFVRFAARVRPGGLLVACADDPGSARLAAAARAAGGHVLTYGRADDADVRVGPGRPGAGGWPVEITEPDGAAHQVLLAVPGDHNALDAAGAWVALRRLGLSAEAASHGLAAFRGTGRRFESRGEAGGVRVVDDYAHHPTEVTALLRTARQVAGPGRVVVLFQPHLFSRTRAFAAQFGAALDLADAVVVTDVYAAREDPDPEVTGDLVVRAVPTPGKAVFVADRGAAARAAAALARAGDLVLTVGAGDVTQLGATILAELAARAAGGGADEPPTDERRPGGAEPGRGAG